MSSEPVGTPRQRAHARTVSDIKQLARDQLGTEGSSGLSLRAIARQLGIVSSAIYRYVPSRDELLTLLIVDAYNDVGDAAEAAERNAGDSLTRRWIAVGQAVRAWAVEHPAEYALVYGSPVPGYAAPAERTVGPGARVIMQILGMLAEATRAGVRVTDDAPVDLPASLATDMRRLREELEITVDDELLSRGLLAWSALYGMVSFEIFGQYANSITDNAAFFEHQLERLARMIGFPDN